MMNRRRGFTLLELVVSMVILAIISVITVRYLVDAVQTYTMLVSKQELNAQAFLALDRMEREVRVLSGIVTADAGALTFTVVSGATNTLRRSDGYLLWNEYPLASHVTNLTVEYYDSTNGLLAPLPLTADQCAAAARLSVTLGMRSGSQNMEIQQNMFLGGAAKGVLR